VTFPDGDRKLWNVVQRGDSGNDYVLTEPIPIHPLNELLPPAQREKPSEDEIKARAATDFMRIRTWSDKPNPMPIVRLLVFGLSDFASGPCEVVR
jgi:hypothetical protein